MADDEADQHDQKKQYGKDRPDNAKVEPDCFVEFSTDVRCMRVLHVMVFLRFA
ncbi:hypothetical protein D3C72_2506350 [compost metagenome]